MFSQPWSLKRPQGFGCFYYGAYFDRVVAALSEFKPPAQERFFRCFNTLFEHRIFGLPYRRLVN